MRKQFGFPTRSNTNRSVDQKLEARDFGSKNKRDYTICGARTKVTARLICAYVFAYACCSFSYAVAQM